MISENIQETAILTHLLEADPMICSACSVSLDPKNTSLILGYGSEEAMETAWQLPLMCCACFDLAQEQARGAWAHAGEEGRSVWLHGGEFALRMSAALAGATVPGLACVVGRELFGGAARLQPRIG